MGEIKTVPLSIVITVCVAIVTTASGWIAYAQVLPESNMMVQAARMAEEAQQLAYTNREEIRLNTQAVNAIQDDIKDINDKLERIVQGLNNIAARLPPK